MTEDREITRIMSRRRFLSLLGATAGAAALTACSQAAPAPTQAPAAAPAPTAAPAAAGGAPGKNPLVIYTGGEPIAPFATTTATRYALGKERHITAMKPKKPYKIAWINKNRVNPAMTWWAKGAEDACKDMGLQFTLLTPANDDNAADQLNVLIDAVQKGFDAIGLLPIDSKGIVPGVERANAANIPVITVGTPALGGKLLTHTGQDYYKAGMMMGQRMMDELKDKASPKMLLMEGVSSAQNAVENREGWKDQLKTNPKFEVLDMQSGMWQRTKGMEVMEGWLRRFPQVDGLISGNMESAIGALQAMQAANRSGIKIVTMDVYTKDAQDAIRNGSVTASLDQDPYGQGYWIVQLFVNNLDTGATYPAFTGYQDIRMVDKGNIALYDRG